MALKKDIEMASHAICTYHRLTVIENEINHITGMWFDSYLSQEDREREKEGAAVFKERLYLTFEKYVESPTPTDCYEFVKYHTAIFENAEDC